MNTKMVSAIAVFAIATIILIVVLVAFGPLASGPLRGRGISSKETFNTTVVHSPNSNEELRNRESIDAKLRRVATNKKGTEKTPIYIIDNFLTEEECKAVIDTATDLFTSELTSNSDDKYFRTSKTADFNGTGIQPTIDQKIYTFMGLPPNTAETTQIQHYKLKNEFKDHVDAFDMDNDHQFWKDGQRTWTVMIYLNDVKRGGTTGFKKLNEECVPKMGRAVIWSSLNKDGSVDQETLHCGTPVLEGEKWITTTWFRDTEQ